MKTTPLNLIQKLKAGAIGVLPTDTIYGLVGCALNQKTVERIYHVKGRTPTKPLIILIADFSDVEKFGVRLDAVTRTLCERFWPGKISIIFKHHNPQFAYLDRGSNTFAFRIPRRPRLLSILRQTGPLVAPSANHEGEEPATTIGAARAMFGEQVDFYVGGRLPSAGKPSTLVLYENGAFLVKREGAVVIPKKFLV